MSIQMTGLAGEIDPSVCDDGIAIFRVGDSLG